MQRRGSVAGGGRVAVVVVVIAAHIVLLAVLLARKPPSPPGPKTVEELVIEMVKPLPPAAPPPAPPPARLLPDPVLAQAVPVAPDIVVAPGPVASATPPWPAGTCAVADRVARALSADPSVRAALAAAPRGVRSDADAVALWNGGWVRAAIDAPAPLATVKQLTEATLADAPRECLDAPMIGPRLLPVPDGRRGVLVVIGSGNWTWGALAPRAALRPTGDAPH